MSAIIYRGSHCRLKFYPQDGISVSSLGDPLISITQENYYLEPDVTVDTTHNCVYADLTEEDTLMMADGIKTECQVAYVTQQGVVTRFPVHTLDVRKTIMWKIEDVE